MTTASVSLPLPYLDDFVPLMSTIDGFVVGGMYGLIKADNSHVNIAYLRPEAITAFRYKVITFGR